MMKARLPVILTAVAIGYFVLAALLVVPYPGIEDDEALFSNGVYSTENMTAAHFVLFDRPVATMIMPYVGALKAWIYSVVFAVWPPSAWSLRVPMLLAGAAAIWCFFVFLRRAAGPLAAVFGAALLATDASFLLTTTFDWGPVALQHLLFLGGMALLVRFYQERSEKALAAGFLLFGLALWDKAVFLWVFSGVVVAGGVLYYREVRSALSVKRVGLAGAAFLLGALPFVAYNVTHDLATLQGKQYTLADWQQNVQALRTTLDGSAVPGFLVDSEPAPEPENTNAVEALSLAVAKASGYPRSSFLPWALVVSVLLAWAAWGTGRFRLLLFFLIAFVMAWFQMLVTAQAGGSAHHTILVWPFVVGFIAVSFSSFAERFRGLAGRGATAVVLVVCLSSVLVWNSCLAGLIRFGPSRMWSDACYALAEAVRPIEPQRIFAADWGMGSALRLLLDGRVPLSNALDPFQRQELDERESEHLQWRLESPGAIFISYTDERDMFPKAKRIVHDFAVAEGYERELLAVVNDGRGRAVFEVYRYVERSSDR